MLNIVFGIRDICWDFDKGRLKINDVSFRNLLDLFLTKLESFSQAIFESGINADPYYFYNMTCALEIIFDFLDENENLLNLSIEEKRLSILKLIIGIQANILKNYLINRDVEIEYLKGGVLNTFFSAFEILESSLNKEDYRSLLKDLLVKLVKYLNDNLDFQNDCVKIVDEFICNLYSRVDEFGERLYNNFVSIIKNIDCIENNGKITENALNDMLVCQFDAEKYLSDNDYAIKKFDYIEQRINYFGETAKNINADDYEYEADTCIRMFENNLEQFWNGCNKLFHIKRSNYMKNKNADNLNEYNRIKNDRATLFNKFRKLEAIKQDLLKQKIIIDDENNFVPLTKCQKIFYTVVLIVTFPIHALIFILVKTLRKLFHCILMGLEPVFKGCIYLDDEIKDHNDCKDKWAEQCENGYFDGLEINGQQISERIKWYETKRWLFWRRILFPINLAVLIIIGVVLAIKKFFKSIIKVFITDYRIVKNIWSDNSTTYMFIDKSIFQAENSEIICNVKGNISVLPIYEGKNIKISNKFVDMSCPSTPYSDFSNSKLLNGLQCAIGWKNIKSAKHWDEYANKHNIPRLYCGYYCESGIIKPKK